MITNVNKVIVRIHFLFFYFHFSMPPNQMALYPNWLIVYVLRVIVPMLMLIIIGVKILLKNGKEIQQAFDIKDIISDVASMISLKY